MEATIIQEIQQRIKRLSEKIGKEQSLSQKRFIGEMLYGMIGSGDSKLSSISRALHEEVGIEQTIKRLSRNLIKCDLSKAVNRTLIQSSLSSIDADGIIAIDGGDIRKPYAESMEHLHPIWDGSRKEKATGYQLFCMASVGKESIKPIYGELYSCSDPEYKSTYTTTTKGLDMLSEAAKGKTLLTIVGDRGYDDEKLYRYYVKNKLRFITRLRKNREFTIEGSTIARQIGDLYGYINAKRTTGEVIHEGKLKKSTLTIGLLHGKIHHMDEEFHVVIVKSPLYQEPVYLLTNSGIETYEAAYGIYVKYLKRWGIEQLYRVMKEKFNIEDVRVMKYRRLRNVFSLMMASLHLVAKLVYKIGNNAKFTHEKIIRAAKRIRDDGRFLYYAVLDGLGALFAQAAVKPIFFEPEYYQTPAYALFYRNAVKKSG